MNEILSGYFDPVRNTVGHIHRSKAVHSGKQNLWGFSQWDLKTLSPSEVQMIYVMVLLKKSH